MIIFLKFKDETGIMSKAVTDLRNKLREIISELKADANTLDNSSNILSEIVTSGKEGIDGVTTAVNEFAEGAMEQADDAQTAVEKMNLLAQEIGQGVQRSELLVENADEVNKRNSKGVKLVRDLTDKFEITRTIN